MGTANLLDACRKTSSVRAILVVTSDKCYENQEWVWGYRETDRLGGHDPYSASKAATEIVVASYRDSYFQGNDAPLLASVRAGNVIGGGDWSEDRLIPDLVRAISQNSLLEIRSPSATRPWQHVLESLSGYLLLGQHLLENRRGFAEGWNFGPDVEGNRTVVEVLTQLKAHWSDLSWQISAQPHPHEANLLYLDSAKARDRLGWKPVWSFSDGVKATADWYREYLEHGNVNSRAHLLKYIGSAQAAEVVWSAA
jgi:CDP-glucose 4,6-dehydratase